LGSTLTQCGNNNLKTIMALQPLYVTSATVTSGREGSGEGNIVVQLAVE
jgi:hypothetical protein